MKDFDGIQVSFSGGRSSAMMAKIMVDNYDREDLLFTFANTGKEMEATLEFVDRCDKEWGLGVVWVEYRNNDQGYELVTFETASRNGEPFEALIEKKGYLPNPVARFCTADLKVRPMKKYLMDQGWEYWEAAVGIRFDEKRRAAKLKANQSRDRWEYILPLHEMRVTEKEVLNFWKSQTFDLGLDSYQGNCDLCFLKGRHNKIQVIKDNPESVEWWQRMEEKVGGTFRKDMTYKDLQWLAEQPVLFDSDPDPTIDCLCGVI